MQECNREARKGRKQLYKKERTRNIEHCRDYAIGIRNQIISRLIKESIQIIDAKEDKSNYAKRKFGNQVNFVVANSRNSF